jgi:CRISPR-associated protein Csd2
MNRREYVVLYDVTNSNPNGNPDAGNQPRMHDDGRGYITDVCIKRKIRNAAEIAGQNIFVQSGENIADKLKQPNLAEVYWDVRMFGAVVTEKGSKQNRSIRGAVQMGFATSINPIDVEQVCITSSVGRKEDQTQTMGHKWIVRHAVYRQEIFIIPHLAKQHGVSEDDIAVFEAAIINMMEFDKSAARPQVNVRGLYRICHDSPIGYAPSWVTTASVNVASLVQPSSGWHDYTVTVAGASMCAGNSKELYPGVTITRLV